MQQITRTQGRFDLRTLRTQGRFNLRTLRIQGRFDNTYRKNGVNTTLSNQL